MASNDRHEDQGKRTAADLASESEPAPATSSSASSDVALLPEPFKVNAEAVDLAAAAARAALRRTTGAFGRFSRPSHPPLLDPFRAATEPLKVP
ncbi:MAG: hypothetical protein H0T76_18185 [Nannocystis sp.]|nr:hypothetical protein [Nannocystis sp.]MBA3548415.1 hypothetical protein [Nannocystis sp.]